MLKEDLPVIGYHNESNPDSGFDIVKHEDLKQRNDIGHNPEITHRVSFYIVLLVRDGQGHHSIDFQDYKLQTRDVLTIRKDQVHRFHFSSELKGDLLLFREDFLVSYLEQIEALKSLQLFNEFLIAPRTTLSELDYKQMKDSVNRMKAEYEMMPDPYALQIIRSELHILITRLFRIKYQTNQKVLGKKHLAEFIKFQELAEKHASSVHTVIEYAQLMATSTKTLNTICKSIINKTAKVMLDEIRIMQIKRRLLHTTDSIKEIAYATGFEETSNFYKFFKRLASQTPESFRQEHGG